MNLSSVHHSRLIWSVHCHLISSPFTIYLLYLYIIHDSSNLFSVHDSSDLFTIHDSSIVSIYHSWFIELVIIRDQSGLFIIHDSSIYSPFVINPTSPSFMIDRASSYYYDVVVFTSTRQISWNRRCSHSEDAAPPEARVVLYRKCPAVSRGQCCRLTRVHSIVHSAAQQTLLVHFSVCVE